MLLIKFLSFGIIQDTCSFAEEQLLVHFMNIKTTLISFKRKKITHIFLIQYYRLLKESFTLYVIRKFNRFISLGILVILSFCEDNFSYTYILEPEFANQNYFFKVNCKINPIILVILHHWSNENEDIHLSCCILLYRLWSYCKWNNL